jgi:hypothetical protein
MWMICLFHYSGAYQSHRKTNISFSRIRKLPRVIQTGACTRQKSGWKQSTRQEDVLNEILTSFTHS